MSDPSHDVNYKRVFSDPKTMADLLRGYVARDWLNLLDLSTLELVPTEHVGTASQRRVNDLIWRLRWQHGQHGDWLYLYLFLEFQSTVDATMPLRFAECISLFYLRLARTAPTQPEQALSLPTVVPIVLYNGRNRWWAATDLARLIQAPPELRPFQLGLRYILIEETRAETSPWAEERNLAAILFRIEQSPTREALIEATQALAAALQPDSEGHLAQAFASLIRDSLARRLPGIAIPPNLPLDKVPIMIGENIADWAEQQAAQREAQGEAHGIIALIRHQVAKGVLTIDQARQQVRDLIAGGLVPREAGEAALRQLG
jgi:hypothetical protein